ncbi:MAG: 50S ribosomal protein L32 [Parachlamydiales bacterium]|nr:50S ribosomal protein L32 [Parachlamydiales bacterium]
MAVPRNRHSNARKNSRSAHSAFKKKTFSKCSNCGNIKMPHRVCASCGFYNQRSVIVNKEEK